MDGVDGDGCTALINASSQRRVDVVNALIGARAAADTQDIKWGETGLINACIVQRTRRCRQHTDWSTRCSGYSAQDKDGWTGLMRASQKGHADIVNALIGARAELDTQDKKNYRTAIWYAPKRGRHSEIEEALRAASRHPN